jgi:nucleoside phosphorylase
MQRVLLGEKTTLEKADGTQAVLEVQFGRGTATTFDVDVPIEPGDILIRTLDNGAIERFEVVEPGYNKRFGDIAANYQCTVRRAPSHPPLTASPATEEQEAEILAHSDVVILTALRVEYSAVRALLTDPQELTHPKGTVYEVGHLGRLRVAIAEIGAGNHGAAMEAERAIAFFGPTALAFVGVAGGVKDVRLGDVVVADKVYGYESGKDRELLEPRPSVGCPAYRFVQRARAEGRGDSWKQGQNITPEAQVHVGAIAAGEKVVASTRSATYDLIKKQYGDTLAVEMEGRGTLHAAHSNDDVDTLIVRGISDCIDNKTEADERGGQVAAAHHAAVFAAHVLAQTVTPRDPNAVPRSPRDRDAPPRPNLKVSVTFGSIIVPGRPSDAVDVVVVRVENHGRARVFLDGGVCFTEKGTTTRGWIGANAFGEPFRPRELEAGDALTLPIRASELRKHKERIEKFFVNDKLGNEYSVSSDDTQAAIRQALDD